LVFMHAVGVGVAFAPIIAGIPLLEAKPCDGTTPWLAQALIAAAATIAAPMVMVEIRIGKVNLTKSFWNR
jgi:hypothetical protein